MRADHAVAYIVCVERPFIFVRQEEIFLRLIHTCERSEQYLCMIVDVR